MSNTSSFDTDEDMSDMDVSEGAGAAEVLKNSNIEVKADQILPLPKIEDFKPEKSQEQIKAPQAKTTKLSKRSLSLSKIPILNKDTISRNTYDLDKLLDSKVQKAALKNLGLDKKSSLKRDRSLNSSRTSTKDETSERLLAYGERQKAQKDKLREESFKKELENCTFKPKINTQSENRSHEAFYEDMKKYLDEKLNKIKTKQEENEQLIISKSLDFPFRPSLCAHSVRIDKRIDNEESRHEKLYRLHKSKDQNLQRILKEKSLDNSRFSQSTEDSQLPFQPTVNKRSKNLVRDTSIDDHLYQDAIRRKQKPIEPPKTQIPEKMISTNSENVLINKLTTEFNENWDMIDIDNIEEVNYSRILDIFRSMYLLIENQKQEEARNMTMEI